MGTKKPSLHAIPSVALLHLGRAMHYGAYMAPRADGKPPGYGLFNWRKDPVSALTYIDAGLRHKLSWADGEEYSKDTEAAGYKVHHLAHDMACNAILLDCIEGDWLNDNRGPKGHFAEVVEAWTTLKPQKAQKPFEQSLESAVRTILWDLLPAVSVTKLNQVAHQVTRVIAPKL